MTTAGYGSDLYSAFSPLNNDAQSGIDSQSIIKDQSPPQTRERDYDINDDLNDNTRETNSNNNNNININRQMVHEQKLMSILNEIKKQKNCTKPTNENDSSYIDKLFSKKKELIKLLQFSLIIILALSVHGIIDFYLKNFIENNDFTSERVLFIRILYPIVILFFLWNLKTFIK